MAYANVGGIVLVLMHIFRYIEYMHGIPTPSASKFLTFGRRVIWEEELMFDPMGLRDTSRYHDEMDRGSSMTRSGIKHGSRIQIAVNN